MKRKFYTIKAENIQQVDISSLKATYTHTTTDMAFPASYLLSIHANHKC